MWKRLLLRVHPDQGGDESLFVWARLVQEIVCSKGEEEDPPPRRSSQPKQRRQQGPPRMQFDALLDFEELTEKAVALAATVDPPYARLLAMLEDLEEVDEDDPLYTQQMLGCTYKTLAAIGHAAGLDGTERTGWYRVAESIPLSQRHGGHILSNLKRKEG
jgi:hypothetical protein